MYRITEQQVSKLMEELTKDGNLSRAAMKAGMSRPTARKYRDGPVPETRERTYRTRDDPFESDWPEMERMLESAPELEGKALFEFLMNRNLSKKEELVRADRPEEAAGIAQYHPGQLRTFQRRLKTWHAMKGPEKEVFFPQEHRPGEAFQTDFTEGTSLGVTIDGDPYDHQLCHTVLPYSNWEHATVCLSESYLALQRGVQRTISRLGRVPEFHQTDQSSAATHQIEDRRMFNDKYKALIERHGMTPRTIGVGKKEQNGDVEALNKALKRRLKQHLLLRGSHDFESVSAYQAFLDQVLDQANRTRSEKITEELEHMRPLRVSQLPNYEKFDISVSSWSTIRVKYNSYSVPSRLIGEKVQVRVYEDHIEVWYGQKVQLKTERLLGRNGHRINYRHIIWSLVRKPGAFLRYKYREDLFPSVTFRRAYDHLEEVHGSGRRADLEYLRVLHLAASTMEDEVETALRLLLDSGDLNDSDSVKSLVVCEPVVVPELTTPEVELAAYDAHVPNFEEVVS